MQSNYQTKSITGSKGTLSYPFCVRSAGVGYGSAAPADEDSCRAELWLPLWNNPSTLVEIEALFSEGRAQVNGRPARNGVDFARSIATLGTDRGISQFVRTGFHARNGLAYFAVPIGSFQVKSQPQVNLLNEIDTWLDTFRRAASSDNAPSRALRGLNRLEEVILKLCQQQGAAQLQQVLIGLGEVEKILSTSSKWRQEAGLRPVPLLSPDWLVQADDGSIEYRLAASLAGISSPEVGNLRQHLESVDVKPFGAFWNEASNSDGNVVWTDADIERNLIAIFQRRCIEASKQNERSADNTLVFPGHSCCFASLGDIESFLNRKTNDQRLAALVRGLCLLDWTQIRKTSTTRLLTRGADLPRPDATFALLKLCHVPYDIQGTYIPLTPEISRLAVAGRFAEAASAAIRRLRGSSLKPIIANAARRGPLSRRLAAALLFPITFSDSRILAQSLLSLEPQNVS